MEIAEALQAAIENPIVTIVATPQNISDTTRVLTDDGTKRNRIGPKDTFALYKVKLTAEESYLPTPQSEDIVTVSDPKELLEHIAGGKVYVFDSDDASTIEALAAQVGAPGIAKELLVTIKTRALEIEGKKEGDVFTIGHYGLAGLDPPNETDDVTPTYGLLWLYEMVTVYDDIDCQTKRLQVSHT